MTLLLIIVIYLIGVLLALVLIAWFNARHGHGFDISPELSLGSWFSIIAYVIIYVTAPFGKLYDWLYNKFKKRR